MLFFFFSSRRRHTRFDCDWSSDVCSSDLHAGEHGTPAQRFYNLVCIAYGADAQLFADLVQKGYLPKERAEGCAEEYQQVRSEERRVGKECRCGWSPEH